MRLWWTQPRKSTCQICGRRDILISDIIGVCLTCLRDSPNEALKISRRGHSRSRSAYNLPATPPKSRSGVRCTFCGNNCIIPNGGVGFCGLTFNEEGRLIRRAGTPERGILEWYYDPLPTNCVAAHTCPAAGVGYPKYAYKPGPEYGYYNLAVFYGACSLDCLYCQNWHYRGNASTLSPVMSAKSLASKVHEKVACICYFGGDPSPQMPHAIATSKIALEMAKGRILRICWETNGLMSRAFLNRAVELSIVSGGVIKFDLKAWTPSVYEALTGRDNKVIFDNFKRVAERFDERPEVPLLVASTLLVPGYVDVYEVRMIARFISEINPEIPYILLAFHPDYLMNDLPPTSSRHMNEAIEVAKKEGVKNVYIGNIHLLGPWY